MKIPMRTALALALLLCGASTSGCARDESTPPPASSSTTPPAPVEPTPQSEEPSMPAASPTDPAALPSEPAETASGAEADATPHQATAPAALPPASPGTAAAALHLLAPLLREALQQAGGTENAAVSSYSIANALELARAGAAGDTLSAFDRVLWGDVNRPSALPHTLMPPRDTTNELVLANRAFAASADFQLEAGYVDRIRQEFDAEVETHDFAAPDTLKAINGWFADRTRGRIPEVLDRLSADARLVLANALYFKGVWIHAFDPARTEAGPFGNAGQTAQYMQQQEFFTHGEVAGAKFVDLPFRGNDYRLRLLLPAGTPAEWIDSGDVLPQAVQAMGRPEMVAVTLPRFNLEAGGDYTRALADLGLAPALADGADFSGISAAGQLRISQVAHRATLSVDEQGAVAAAATAVTLSRSAATEPVRLVFDRPFIALLLQGTDDTALTPVMAAVVHQPGS